MNRQRNVDVVCEQSGQSTEADLDRSRLCGALTPSYKPPSPGRGNAGEGGHWESYTRGVSLQCLGLHNMRYVLAATASYRELARSRAVIRRLLKT